MPYNVYERGPPLPPCNKVRAAWITGAARPRLQLAAKARTPHPGSPRLTPPDSAARGAQ